MHRRAFLVGAAALSAGCLGRGSGGDGSPGTTSYDIGMTLQAFEPATLTVPMGTEVVWKNTSSRGHTVTAYENLIPDEADYFATGGYDSQSAAYEAFNTNAGGLIYGGETFSHTFEIPGTYEYVCIPHERGGMKGTIEVTNSAAGQSGDGG